MFPWPAASHTAQSHSEEDRESRLESGGRPGGAGGVCVAACLLIPVPAMYTRPGTAGPPRPHQVGRQEQAGSGGLRPSAHPCPPSVCSDHRGEEARPAASKHASPQNDLFLPIPPRRGRTARAPASPTLRPKRIFWHRTPDCTPWGRRAGKAGELIFAAGLATPGSRRTN